MARRSADSQPRFIMRLVTLLTAGRIHPRGSPAGYVSFERQSDGRMRTSSLLPDEDFQLVVDAKGYKPVWQSFKLAEGAVQECEVKLPTLTPQPKDSSKTSGPGKPPRLEMPMFQAMSFSYTGQVTDTITGKPLAGATVTVVRSLSSATEQTAIRQKLDGRDQAANRRTRIVLVCRNAAASGRKAVLYIGVTVEHPNYVPFYHGRYV